MSIDIDQFFQLSLDLICVAGTDGFFKRINPAFVKTLKYSQEELLARPFLDFIHPEDLESTLAEVEKLSVGEPTIHFENRYRTGDGRWVWLSWRAAPVHEHGLIYAMARDMTEQRASQQMQQALHAKTAFEQGRVQMATGILHDLGNALTGVSARTVDANTALAEGAMIQQNLDRTIGFLQARLPALQESLGEQTEPLLNLLQVISDRHRAVRGRAEESLMKSLAFIEHAQSLLSTHRSYSGAGSGPSRERLSIDRILRDAQMLMSDAVHRRSGRIEVQTPRSIPAVRVEHASLMQVLINLIKNAIEATDDQQTPPRITLTAGVLPDRVWIEVMDNGCGFEAALAARLLEDGYTTRSRGSGVGLTSVQRVLRILNGTLHLSSPGPGQGATARIEFPVEELS
jgi:PAS domain S-box-containing protein